MTTNDRHTKVYLATDLAPVNHLSLNTFYHHLIGVQGIYLYYQLHNIHQILVELKSNGLILLKDLLKDLNWNQAEFNQTKNQLEQVGLLKTTFSTINGQNLLLLELIKPINLEAILSNEKLVSYFQQQAPEHWSRVNSLISTLTNDQYYQQKLSSGSWDISQHHPIDLTQPQELNSDDKAKFYGLIYDSLGRAFEVSDAVYHLVFLHIQPDSELTLNHLAKLAYCSLIKTDQGYQVNLTKFQNKINEALNPEPPAISDYQDFWRDLINYDDHTLNLKYQQLFETVSPENFCLKFLKTSKLGARWKKWIDQCFKEEFSVGTINLMISFTHVWIKKLNLKYLENVSETCADSRKNVQEILNHFKSVIISDIETKDNRLKVNYRSSNHQPIRLLPTINETEETTNNDCDDFDFMMDLLDD